MPKYTQEWVWQEAFINGSNPDANGFNVASHVADYLKGLGYEVLIISNFYNADIISTIIRNSDGTEFETSDIETIEQLDDVLPQELVIYLNRKFPTDYEVTENSNL